MDLESPRDHVDARADLLGVRFPPLTIRYVLTSWGCFISLSARYDFTAVFARHYGLLRALTAPTIYFMILRPVFHCGNLLYASTAIRITRCAISHPISITGIYYTP